MSIVKKSVCINMLKCGSISAKQHTMGRTLTLERAIVGGTEIRLKHR